MGISVELPISGNITANIVFKSWLCNLNCMCTETEIAHANIQQCKSWMLTVNCFQKLAW